METHVLDPEGLAVFKASVRGGVLQPDDAGYDSARRVWNERARPRQTLTCPIPLTIKSPAPDSTPSLICHALYESE